MTSDDKLPTTIPTPPSTTDHRVSNDNPATTTKTMAVETPELDDFGLPIRRYTPNEPAAPAVSSSSASVSNPPQPTPSSASFGKPAPASAPAEQATAVKEPKPVQENTSESASAKTEHPRDEQNKGGEPTNPQPRNDDDTTAEPKLGDPPQDENGGVKTETSTTEQPVDKAEKNRTSKDDHHDHDIVHEHHKGSQPLPTTDKFEGTVGEGDIAKDVSKRDSAVPAPGTHIRGDSLTSAPGISEFSHQQITKPKEKDEDGDGDWQEMPAYAPYDLYDDDDRLIAKEHHEEENESYGYAGLGGAGKGYTRVLLDDDAESATSMDENTNYLFKNAGGTGVVEEDDLQRDAVSQLQATKDLLTEGQRIAYVGLTRLELSSMVKEAEELDPSNKKKPKKEVRVAAESMKMWSQKMMIRLYSHMDISPAEQVMIEQLSEHGVVPADLTEALMQNSRVQNPMREKTTEKSDGVAEMEEQPEGEAKPMKKPKDEIKSGTSTPISPKGEQSPAEPPPEYEAHAHDGEDMPGVRTPGQLPTTQKLDIDLRWTVLCDLFLVLIADSIYDSRSRTLLERIGKDLEISWMDICRFEKRVTDALEMQQAAEKENWNEEEHMETRRKLALQRRYVMMGLATVGGGLVIGLSAGLLAPVIGAGLAAGFTTIGVTGTSSFLAGTAGAAIITSGAAASGSYIGGKAADRRTGAVKTFEYRPLHNNKRVNLIVTVSGWMTGKVDDVRLPFSTVDPTMGDIYSILWEPEMLTSMGDTINILATEALTQGLQQILGSTILISLMAALQLPVVLTKLSYLIDNPWAVSLDRATSAGLILADSLIQRNLGTRPVTLVGYSLGSRVIFSCLQELAKKGAYGLVQNVYMFGSPVVVKTDEFLRARTVVSGRFVNGYNRSDWILGYLFRLTNGGIRRVGGLGPVDEIKGIENIDVTEYVVGHMDYRRAMPRLMREACGWLVESDEFSEIEDPDPTNHQERQRELINEIEEARKELEKKGIEEAEAGKKKSRFSLFGRKKKLEKAEWEVYQDPKKRMDAAAAADTSKHGGADDEGGAGLSSGKTEDAEGNNHGVLFDVDAIRAELAREAAREKAEAQGGGKKDAAADGWGGRSRTGEGDEEEMFEVKEIKSTLPPMKLDIYSSSPSSAYTPSPSTTALYGNTAGRPSMHGTSFRETKSTSNIPYRPGSFDSRRPVSPMPPAKSPAHQYGGGHGTGQSGGGGWGDDDDEGEISMTFDTSFRDPMSSSPPGASAFAPPPPPPKDTPDRYSGGTGVVVTVTDTSRNTGDGSGGWGGGNGFGSADGYGNTWGDTVSTSRPETKTAKTVPAGKNPWADAEDEFDDPDFGKEKGDIEMTFA